MYKVIHSFDGKIRGTVQLNKGDKVIVVQEVDKNWYFGCKGDTTGFIPISYVARDENSDLNDILLSIDSAVSKIRNTLDSNLSKEQRSAVRKLLKFRENVVEQERKRQTILNSPPLSDEPTKNDAYCDTRDMDLLEDGGSCESAGCIIMSNARDCELPDSSTLPTECAKYPSDEEFNVVSSAAVMECDSAVFSVKDGIVALNHEDAAISKQLIEQMQLALSTDAHDAVRYLVECVRVHTQANNEACLRTIHSFLTYFAQFPLFVHVMKQLEEELLMLNDTDNAAYGFEESQDWYHIDRILCSAERRSADLQRRGGDLDDDAEMLSEEHSQLVELLTKADSQTVRSRLCHAELRSFLALITLYELKTDRETRLTLLPVFNVCVKAERSCLLALIGRTSFLSQLLLDGCAMDGNSSAANGGLFESSSLSLLTTIISPGMSLPNDLVDLFCGNVLGNLLTLITNVDDCAKLRLVTNVIQLIFAFHLCLKNEKRPDRVFCSLLSAADSNASAVHMCIARILQIFEKNEDTSELLAHSLPPVNAVSQFVRDLFCQPDLQGLLSCQDCDVFIDIMNRKLSVLTISDSSVVSEYLLLLDLFVRNSLYTQRMYKSSDLRRALRRIGDLDGLSSCDKLAAKNLSQLLFRGVTV